MDKIKELTDFYMWMQENGYDHNIRARVEKKAEMFLNSTNVGKNLTIHSVVMPKGTLSFDPKCDDACKFYCTKGNTQYPECLK